jgi:membrane protein implicated in regulation of membrane protease activity
MRWWYRQFYGEADARIAAAVGALFCLGFSALSIGQAWAHFSLAPALAVTLAAPPIVVAGVLLMEVLRQVTMGRSESWRNRKSALLEREADRSRL